jgi:hypothetical protein
MRTLINLLVVFGTACGSDDNTPPQDAPADASVTVPDASCFMNPTTHKEIINACTNAQKIERNVTPPLLNPDGTLPPLP